VTPDDALDVLDARFAGGDERAQAIEVLRAWARDIRTNPIRVVVECRHGLPPAQVRGTLPAAERERVRLALADSGGQGADAVLRDALLTVDVFDVPGSDGVVGTPSPAEAERVALVLMDTVRRTPLSVERTTQRVIADVLAAERIEVHP
jgi:hypothetical protein